MKRFARGAALVAVLWVVLLLTVISTAVATRSLESRWTSARVGQGASLGVIADSAIRLTLSALIANARFADRPLPVPNRFTVAGDSVDVSVDAESGRLDLNTADDHLVVAYLRAAGWEAGEAQTFVNRLRDWQDADDVVRESGLERDDYAALGEIGLPSNGPLESVEEIRQIPGADRLSPALLEGLTVYSHLTEPIGNLPSSVEQAVKFANEHQLGGRAWRNRAPNDEATRFPAGAVVRINACSHRSALTGCRQAIVRLTGSASEPVQVFVWRSVLNPS